MCNLVNSTNITTMKNSRHSDQTKENIFSSKFRMLNTQGFADDIQWSSSSDSSEYETALCKERLNTATNKRCRKRKRKQALKNVSNLEVTVVNTRLSISDTKLQNNQSESSCKDANATSPILGKPQQLINHKCKKIQGSPILPTKSTERQNSKSPILVLKSSPKPSPMVSKILFNLDKGMLKSKSCENHADFNSNDNLANICLDRRKNIASSLPFTNENEPVCRSNAKSSDNQPSTKSDVIQESKENNHSRVIQEYKENNQSRVIQEYKENNQSRVIQEYKENNQSREIVNYTIQETPEYEDLDESIVMPKTTSKELSKKVQSYFESHFSSGNSSQITISDTPTPKNDSKSSDDIEISNTITQVVLRSAESNQTDICDTDLPVNKTEKKLRYRKDGLAYRLNSLLKKQNANVSLWHHERFLANNSNFAIPKGEFHVFRICQIEFKYGLYSLKAVDTNDQHFIVIINKMFVTNDSVIDSTIIKVYEPFTVLDFRDNCKLIINVCKFECDKV